MIIFARAPGTTGWVEIKPEEELSHRIQFWEIRKFAVEQEDATPLARRLDRAEQALKRAGFVDHGAKDWKPPVGPTPPIFAVEALPRWGIGKFDADICPRMDGDYLDRDQVLELLRIVPKTLAVPAQFPDPRENAVRPFSFTWNGDTDADFAALLPGTYYMDPPDGGSVTVLEQFKRMAHDALRYRLVRQNAYCFGVAHPTAEECDRAVDYAIAVSKAGAK